MTAAAHTHPKETPVDPKRVRVTYTADDHDGVLIPVHGTPVEVEPVSAPVSTEDTDERSQARQAEREAADLTALREEMAAAISAAALDASPMSGTLPLADAALSVVRPLLDAKDAWWKAEAERMAMLDERLTEEILTARAEIAELRRVREVMEQQSDSAEKEIERLRGVVRDHHAQALATAEQLGRESDRRADEASAAPVSSVEPEQGARTLHVSWHPDAIQRAVQHAKQVLDSTADPDASVVGPLTWMDLACLVDAGRAFAPEKVVESSTPSDEPAVTDLKAASKPAVPEQAQPREPRVWFGPEGSDPGDVDQVTDRDGHTWSRRGYHLWVCSTGFGISWESLQGYGPLTEVVEAPAGQDGGDQ